MFKIFKLMTSSFIMAITFAAPQLSHAMQAHELPEAGRVKGLVAKYKITEAAIKDESSAKGVTLHSFPGIHADIRKFIVKIVVFDRCLNNISPAKLAGVNKEWAAVVRDEMKPGKPSYQAWYGLTTENEHIYQQFLRGRLLYKPYTDGGLMVTLKIEELANQLEGKLDLSACGFGKIVEEKLSISIGKRKKLNPENQNKIEIWLAANFRDTGKEPLFTLSINYGSWTLRTFCRLSSTSLKVISSQNLSEIFSRADIKKRDHNPETVSWGLMEQTRDMFCKNFRFDFNSDDVEG